MRNTGHKKTGKRKGAAITFIAAVAIVTLALNLFVINTAKPFIITAEEAAELFGEEGKTADCILVLGASVSEYGPSPILAARLDKAMELFGLGVSEIMLLSGDNRTMDYNEVQAMKDYALKKGGGAGLGAENIYLDGAGFSTYNSAKRCKDVFQAEKVIVVTQRYHLYRAVFNAKRVGLDVYGVAAGDMKSGQALRDLREIPARVKDFFLTLIGYTPKIMGDPVPLDFPSTQ